MNKTIIEELEKLNNNMQRQTETLDHIADSIASLVKYIKTNE